MERNYLFLCENLKTVLFKLYVMEATIDKRKNQTKEYRGWTYVYFAKDKFHARQAM